MWMADTLLELVSAALAHELGQEAAVPPESQRRTLFRKIQTFIEHNLGDPDLTPPIPPFATDPFKP
jgi:hypothetical protein